MKEYISHEPINTKSNNLRFKDGKNLYNINLDIKPSPFSILQLLYRIWDISGLKIVDIPLYPYNVNLIHFDRNKKGQKFFHSEIKHNRYTDNDGIWYLTDEQKKISLNKIDKTI